MKDFYDVWLIMNDPVLDTAALLKAVKATFNQRKTPISINPICFSEEFANHPSKNAQWNALIRKGQFDMPRGSFPKIVGKLKVALNPILARIA